jgi:hypothetical protein
MTPTDWSDAAWSTGVSLGVGVSPGPAGGVAAISNRPSNRSHDTNDPADGSAGRGLTVASAVAPTFDIFFGLLVGLTHFIDGPSPNTLPARV